MNIAFVFTNFNNSQFARAALDSILRSDAKESIIVIVDNASVVEEVNILKQMEENYPSLVVLYNTENIGYFGGLNIGIKYVQENLSNVNFLVIGNNDLLFPQNFLASILACRDRFIRYPVVSPNISTLDGTSQNPHVISNISKFRELIYDLYHLNYYLAGLILKVAKLTHKFTDRTDEEQHGVAQEIYQGYGACYILGPVFFRHYKELWAPSFLMYEEFFLAKQLEEKGYKIFYEPSIKVQHHCHASTGQLPGRKRWELSRAAHREYRKHVSVWR